MSEAKCRIERSGAFLMNNEQLTMNNCIVFYILVMKMKPGVLSFG